MEQQNYWEYNKFEAGNEWSREEAKEILNAKRTTLKTNRLHLKHDKNFKLLLSMKAENHLIKRYE